MAVNNTIIKKLIDLASEAHESGDAETAKELVLAAKRLMSKETLKPVSSPKAKPKSKMSKASNDWYAPQYGSEKNKKAASKPKTKKSVAKGSSTLIIPGGECRSIGGNCRIRY